MVKCPKCDSSFTSVRLENVDVKGAETWNGVAYACPHCSVAFGVAIDPVTLNADAIEAILRHLGRA